VNNQIQIKTEQMSNKGTPNQAAGITPPSKPSVVVPPKMELSTHAADPARMNARIAAINESIANRSKPDASTIKARK
jgi:hypothetical protein